MDISKLDQIDPERDVLRARFTVWMDVTLSRASKKFSKQMEDKLKETADVISLDQLPQDCIADPRTQGDHMLLRRTDFEFEEERLAHAFAELPLMRQEVLRLLFIEGLDPEEISDILHCSRSYVHLQKFRALEKLRQLLEKGQVETYEE